MPDKSVAERIRERRGNAVDPEEFLREVGAIQVVTDGEQLQFTREFSALVREHVEQFREEDVEASVLADIFGVEESEVSEADRPYTAYKVVYTIYSWPSADALTFDAATHTALREHTDRWEEVPPKQRYRILQSLRSFQDECFFCGGPMLVNDEPVESCCSEKRVVTLHCGDCERRFLEFGAEPSEAAGIRDA